MIHAIRTQQNFKLECMHACMFMLLAANRFYVFNLSLFARKYWQSQNWGFFDCLDKNKDQCFSKILSFLYYLPTQLVATYNTEMPQ
jgi:hypothetical protein